MAYTLGGIDVVGAIAKVFPQGYVRHIEPTVFIPIAEGGLDTDTGLILLLSDIGVLFDHIDKHFAGAISRVKELYLKNNLEAIKIKNVPYINGRA